MYLTSTNRTQSRPIGGPYTPLRLLPTCQLYCVPYINKQDTESPHRRAVHTLASPANMSNLLCPLHQQPGHSVTTSEGHTHPCVSCQHVNSTVYLTSTNRTQSRPIAGPYTPLRLLPTCQLYCVPYINKQDTESPHRRAVHTLASPANMSTLLCTLHRQTGHRVAPSLGRTHPCVSCQHVNSTLYLTSTNRTQRRPIGGSYTPSSSMMRHK